MGLPPTNGLLMPKKAAAKKQQRIEEEEDRDLEIEISFIEGVVKRDPEYVEALEILSEDYSMRGDFEEGLKIDQKLANMLPSDPKILYNLACRYSLTNHVRQAVTTLRKAIKCGFDDFRLLDRDPDLDNIRNSISYKKLKANLPRR